MVQALTASQMCLRARLTPPVLLRATATIQLPGRCASLPLQLQVRLVHDSPRQPLLRTTMVRWQSGPQPQRGRRPPPPPPPQISFFIFASQILGGSLRSLVTPFQGKALREAYKDSPVEVSIALVILVGLVGIFGYIANIYFSYFYSRQFTRYPPPVAKYMRRALYFSKYQPDPKRALQNFRLALEQCVALGLDPLSEDVLGIRIHLAGWLEEIENYDAAIKLLELVLDDCRQWIATMEQTVKDGTAKDDGTMSARLPPRKKTKEEEAKGDIDETETLWARRSRLLQKSIGVSVKLGALYADEHVLKSELAHERLVWAVETALGEFRRRSTDGVKPGEGPWMTPKEMGGALESLANSYESQSNFQLALPLFFQALRVCDDPCHTAVIMNNLAISFAQHPIQPPYDTLVGPLLETPSDKVPTQEEARTVFLDTAKRWATNAHLHARDTKDEARTPECDTACAVSLCNLGDIAALMGDFAEARRRFQQGRKMSETFGFTAGMQQADAGLKRLPSV